MIRSTYPLLLLVIALSTSMALVGCASMGTQPTQPNRPAYTGPDQVSRADASQLLGRWSVTDLNPIPDVAQQATTIEYRDDGTVFGLIQPMGESKELFGNTQFELTGQWLLEGDTVKHQNIEMKTIGDSALGSIIGAMVNNREGIEGQANIYELSTSRMVMVGSDGAAMEYIRQ